MKCKRQKAKGKGDIKKIKFFLKLFTFYFLLFTFAGCEAFVRKFTRKPKKENLAVTDMVVAPQEYPAPFMTPEEQYRQFFLYWKSWHDELIEALSYSQNQKKQISCANEAIKNLNEIRPLLVEEAQGKLNTYINELSNLLGFIVKDIYGQNSARNRLEAERIKRNILRDFSYPKVGKYVIQGSK